MNFSEILTKIDDLVWGIPLIVMIMLVGLVLTLRSRGVQFLHLGKAFRFMFKNEEEGAGEVSSFGALCTSLSATIGTGNIVGVATAVCTGGPGALFWMEVAALFGMATKYSEGLLAVKYRIKDGNGKMLSDVAFMAHHTVVLGGIKYANVLFDGADCCGKLHFGDIGLNAEGAAFIVSASDACIEERRKNTHKGDFGRIRIVGGCKNYVGAPMFSALGAIRAGAGLTTLCVPESMSVIYSGCAFSGYTLDFLPDDNGYCVFCEDKAKDICQRASVIAVGSGMGNSEETRRYVEYFIRNFDGTLVLDADGINAIATNPSILKERRGARTVLTPHVGEFKRMLPWDHSVQAVVDFAAEYGVCVAVKGARTVITDGKSIAVNISGTPALAKGGSGDILAGMCAAFCATYSPFHALVRACYYLGKAGEYVSAHQNEITSTPLDVIDAIKHVV